jgi:predicted nuclease of predicted toxin-antitoxin system
MVRFFLDNDVPVSVATMLRRRGHQCWTAAEAGLAAEGEDDNLTVYAAEHRAVLVTLDRQFIQRRRTNSIEQHLRLRCSEPEAAEVLGTWLSEVLEYLERDHVTVTVSRLGVKADSDWA